MENIRFLDTKIVVIVNENIATIEDVEKRRSEQTKKGCPFGQPLQKKN